MMMTMSQVYTLNGSIAGNNREALSNEPSDSMSGPQRKHQEYSINNLIKLEVDFLLAPKQARLPIP
jgi:hypothetical protein